MVDEYQDTNRAQLELLVHLAGAHRNVCVVGDDDQCIYSWRGAEVRNILDFERHFPGGKEVRLEQNYRSTQVILDAANAVIEKNPERRAKRMWTDRAGGALVQVVCTPNEEDEARYVASEVKKAVAQGFPPDEIAVLYRVNGQARFFEEFLREKDVRYEVVGGSEFFDRREVKDVIAYFKVIANPRDEVSLLRIVNVPARGIGDVTMERLTSWAIAEDASLWEAMGRARDNETLPQGAGDKVVEFVELIERYRKAFTKGNLAELTQRLLTDIGFVEHARSHAPSLAAGDRKKQAIDQVIASLEAYERKEGPKASLLTYLNRLALDTKEEEDEPHHTRGRVTLMTLHGAKGLEWRLVFLVGVEEDLLPHSGMQGEPPNPEEERRLCYVGMTRARERLVMTRSATRIRRGRELVRTPSRFLGDIPTAFCDVIDIGAVPEGPPTVEEKSFFANLRGRLKTSAPTAPLPPDQKAQAVPPLTPKE
jgi:DNA helicase-2/ATP-dependent DNA helicase PcrA